MGRDASRLGNAVVEAGFNTRRVNKSPAPPMALPSTARIRLNAAAGLLAIGAVALVVQRGGIALLPPQRARWPSPANPGAPLTRFEAASAQ